MLTTLVMLGKEAFQLMHAQREYFFNWENWVQMGIILNVGLIRGAIQLTFRTLGAKTIPDEE